MSNRMGSAAEVSGDLRRYPFPRLLFWMLKKKLTGSLTLSAPEQGTGSIYLREGVIVFSDIPSSRDVLGRILLERDLINQEAFHCSLQELSEGKELQGQILLEMGVIDEATLIQGLKIQLQRKVLRVFALPDSRFVLKSTEHDYGLHGMAAQVRVDPLQVIYQGIRQHFDHQRMQAELTRLMDIPLMLRPAFSRHLHRFHMEDDEQALVTLLARAPLQLREILRVSHLGPVATEMVVYTLWVTEMLAPISAARTVGPVQGAPAARPAGLSPEPGAASPPGGPSPLPETEALINPVEPDWTEGDYLGAGVIPLPAEGPESLYPEADLGPRIVGADGDTAGLHRQLILETHQRLSSMSHFEILGLSREASPEEIRDAFLRLAKEFHPDRCSALGVRDVVGQAGEVFRRINDAHNVLGDPQSRKEYEDELDGKSSKKEIEAVLRAEFAFQKGMVFFRKKDFAGAEELFKEAFELNPKEGEHLAWKAWSLFSDPHRDRGSVTPAVERDLKDALAISPHSAACRYLLGELYMTTGNENKAMDFFQRTLEIQPNHLEAERALRILRMRRDKRRAEESSKNKGLLDRLLGRSGKNPKEKRETGGRGRGRERGGRDDRR